MLSDEIAKFSVYDSYVKLIEELARVLKSKWLEPFNVDLHYRLLVRPAIGLLWQKRNNVVQEDSLDHVLVDLLVFQAERLVLIAQQTLTTDVVFHLLQELDLVSLVGDGVLDERDLVLD